MEHTAVFQRFMHELTATMGSPPATSQVGDEPTRMRSNVADFHIEITEGTSCDVVFCVRLGIAAELLTPAAMQIVLGHNMPRQEAWHSVLGLHREVPELCLWYSEAVENLPLPTTLEMIKRLVLQASNISNQLKRCVH